MSKLVPGLWLVFLKVKEVPTYMAKACLLKTSVDCTNVSYPHKLIVRENNGSR